MVDFFVSYNSSDLEVAEHIVRTLEERGARCWIAPRDVPPGADYREAIFDAVCSSDAMLLLFSKGAASSDHISREVFLAGEQKKKIIPLKLDDVVPSGRLAYSLAGLHWIDFLENRDSAIEFILKQRKAPTEPDSAEAEISAKRPSPIAASQSSKPSSPVSVSDGSMTAEPPKGFRRGWLFAGIGAAVILCLYLVIAGIRGRTPSVDPRIAGKAATECTELAGSKYDLPGEFAGVDFEKIDHERAVPICRKAVEYYPDDAGLQHQLARALTAAGEYPEAVQILNVLADENYAPAQTNLGYMYLNGYGVTQNDTEAARWTRKAADQGNNPAQNNLGWMYLNGRGVEQDETEALKWYRLAAEEAHAPAQNSLGWMHFNGRGVKQDETEALKWYRLAADQDNAPAQFNLGWAYENGRGVEQDDTEALKWYRLAADQGYAPAQYNLGVLYAKGQGVEKSDLEAVKWYRLAADQGDVAAQTNLGWIYLNGLGVDQNDSKAMKWYRLAADQGNATAQFNLGWAYEKGRGVKRSISAALDWYKKAASQGHEKAAESLKRLNGDDSRDNSSDLVFRSYRNPLSSIDPATWTRLTKADASPIVKNLVQRISSNQFPSDDDVSIAERRLTAYKDLRFLEVQLRKGQKNFFGYCLWSTNEFVPLNGVAQPLHDLSARRELDIFSQASANEYIYLFVNTLIAENGRFLLIDNIKDIPFTEDIDKDSRKVLLDGLVPLTFVSPEWDEKTGQIKSFHFKGTILYGNAVFMAQFRFRPTGAIEMFDDEPLMGNLPIVMDKEVESITFRTGG